MQQCSIRALALLAAFCASLGLPASASAEIAPGEATTPPAAVAASACPKVAGDSVIETLNRLYGAARSHDESALRAVLAADFHGLEGSERLSSDAMVAD
ncbi:MAG: hypothetical protein KGI67_14580, partial [Pseudomonadota bacterium]|nr:hypothetical protein [Pseudomonadota bacterium]